MQAAARLGATSHQRIALDAAEGTAIADAKPRRPLAQPFTVLALPHAGIEDHLQACEADTDGITAPLGPMLTYGLARHFDRVSGAVGYLLERFTISHLCDVNPFRLVHPIRLLPHDVVVNPKIRHAVSELHDDDQDARPCPYQVWL